MKSFIDLGVRIRQVRTFFALTQPEFSKIVDISTGYVSELEQGKRMPGGEILLTLHNEFDVNIVWLLSGEGEMIDIAKANANLSNIAKRGIDSLEDIQYLADKLRKAYLRAGDNSITAAWVDRLIRAFQLLLSKSIHIENKLLNVMSLRLLKAHTANIFAPVNSPHDLSSNLAVISEHITSQPKASRAWALSVVESFIILVRTCSVPLNKDNLLELNQLLRPWCFWVAKHAIAREISPGEIDTSLLLQPYRREFSTLTFSRSSIAALVNFSTGWKDNKKPFSCEFTLVDTNEENRTKATFVCTASQFAELMELFSSTNPYLISPMTWSIKGIQAFNRIPYIQKNDVRVYVEQRELDDFVSLVNEISDNLDVKSELARIFADEFGAL